MAQDQGTQFEWCVLHTAYSRLTNPEVLSSTQLKTKEKAFSGSHGKAFSVLLYTGFSLSSLRDIFNG